MQITSLVALSLPTGILNVGSFILPSIFIGTLVVNVINKMFYTMTLSTRVVTALCPTKEIGIFRP